MDVALGKREGVGVDVGGDEGPGGMLDAAEEGVDG